MTRLIVPLVIEQILAATIGIADTVMVASVGEAAVSGVSLVDTMNMLLINIFAALSTGGAIVVAQYLGRDDDENANIAAKQLLLATIFVSLVLMSLCLVGQRIILSTLFQSAEASVMQSALIYFGLSALSYPFIAIYNSCAALFRAQGNSKISMISSFVMNVLNITGNAIFIFGLHMGVAGAGLASLLSRIIGALFLLIVLHNEHNRVSVSDFRHWKLDLRMTKKILRIGVPNGLENGVFQIGKILVQGLIASFGTAAIAANAMGNSIMTMANIPGNAIGLALITVVGQCIGAGRPDDAKKHMIQLTGIAYLMVGGLTLVILIFLDPLIGVFGLSQAAADTARQLCIIAGIGNFLFWPSSFTLPNGLRAANDVKYTMLVSIFSMCAFRVVISYVIAQGMGFGAAGVWFAMVIDWVFRSGMFVWRLFSGKWKNHSLI